MRPKSVVLFERLLIVSTILGALDIPLHNDKPFALAMFLILTGIFWFFIVRRASNIARWIFAIALAVGMVRLPAIYVEARQLGMAAVLLALGVAALRIVGAALLFRKDASEWFKTKGRGPDFGDVFS